MYCMSLLFYLSWENRKIIENPTLYKFFFFNFEKKKIEINNNKGIIYFHFFFQNAISLLNQRFIDIFNSENTAK